jgi:hypothetical protein
MLGGVQFFPVIRDSRQQVDQLTPFLAGKGFEEGLGLSASSVPAFRCLFRSARR